MGNEYEIREVRIPVHGQAGAKDHPPLDLGDDEIIAFVGDPWTQPGGREGYFAGRVLVRLGARQAALEASLERHPSTGRYGAPGVALNEPLPRLDVTDDRDEHTHGIESEEPGERYVPDPQRGREERHRKLRSDPASGGYSGGGQL
jgi:hypothetical protein